MDHVLKFTDLRRSKSKRRNDMPVDIPKRFTDPCTVNANVLQPKRNTPRRSPVVKIMPYLSSIQPITVVAVEIVPPGPKTGPKFPMPGEKSSTPSLLGKS
jgi:hypothetical protein